MNFLPLWTAMVCPTMSGVMVERLDQVLITLRLPLADTAWILRPRCSSTKAPFFTDRDIDHLLSRRLMMNRSVRLLLRVLYPLVGSPHGLTGWRPPEVFPSPPPCGWSMGFIATPRTVGRIPSQRVLPAFPIETFSWSRLPTWPMVAWQISCTRRISPDGSLICTQPASLARSCAELPALLTSCPPRPGFS